MNLKSIIGIDTCLCTHVVAFYLLGCLVLIQNSKGFKNPLKMNLENCFGKRKANSFPLLLSSLSAC
jgi:preprotein translocase subunit SecG